MDSCTLKLGASYSMYNETFLKPKTPQKLSNSSQFYDPKTKEFMGQSLITLNNRSLPKCNNQSSSKFYVQAQASICVSKALRWWDKTLKPNMVEIHSAQQFVDTLKNSGDKLVIVDFYSPGCGGCKSLHPKICQLAELNPETIIVKVNYEDLKPMCHALHIHVLPFFRFYRGAEGRVCSFSCTISTIKKFKDALAKHGTERCSLGPAKGLDESELLKLASIGELSLNSSSSSSLIKEDGLKEFDLGSIGIFNPLEKAGNSNAMLVA